MCGIAGYVGAGAAAIPPPILRGVLDSIAHRGPDDEGIATIGEDAVLLHRRLSILDLSAAGHQPMSDAGARHWLSYNGEIYNYRELRRGFEGQGAAFKSGSDTEVLLHALVAEQERCLERLNGIFAFAHYDAGTRELLLVRDALGVKPLYWAATPKGLYFGSEIKAILAFGTVDRALNTEALSEFAYYGAALGERTLFRGIHKLPPGMLLRYRPGSVPLLRRWWEPRVAEFPRSFEDGARELRRHLSGAVRRQLVSDVPIAVFLSGGLDSSVVTALAAQDVPRLKAYTVSFDFENAGGEVAGARALAKSLGVDHAELHISGKNHDLPQLVEQMVVQHDQPFSDAANIPLYLLCQALKGSEKVVLQGDGGDEIFAGYQRYAILRHLPDLMTRLRLFEAPWLGQPSSDRVARALRMLRAVTQREDADIFAALLTQEDRSFRAETLYSAPLREAVRRSHPFARYREVAAGTAGLDRAQAMLLVDLQIILPEIFLEKVDKATMAAGIESRVPLLDLELVSFMLSVPSRHKVRGWTGKALLREAARDLLPQWILRGRKRGFGVPYGRWLATHLRGHFAELLDEHERAGSPVLDVAALRATQRRFENGNGAAAFRLWKAFNLLIWLRRYHVS